MITFSKKKYGIIINEVWFAKEQCNKGDIIRYYASNQPFGKLIRNASTLYNDLTVSSEEIIEKFSKNCKYEVRRASRENVICKQFRGHEVSDEQINLFTNLYYEFYNTKGLEVENRERFVKKLRQLRKDELLVLSEAQIDGYTLVYHTYMINEKLARLTHSASLFRTDDKVPKNIVGMGNRLLHYEDMLYLKDNNIDIYDWGGAGTNENVVSITQFKEGFGGIRIDEFDSIEARTIKGKLYNNLLQVYLSK